MYLLSRSATRGAFIRGLLQPSPVAVAIAATILTLGIGFCFFRISPDFVAQHGARYLPMSGRDHSFFVTNAILELQQSEDTRPLLLIVGASVTRASYGSEASLERKILESTGRDVEVRVLCIGRQPLIQNIANIDEVLTDKRPTTVVFGIGPGNFFSGDEVIRDIIEEPRLGYRSERINLEAERLGLASFRITNNYFYDNLDFFMLRRLSPLKNVLSGPFEQEQTRYIGRNQKPPKKFHEHSMEVLARLDDFQEGMPYTFDLLNRSLERWRQFDSFKIIFSDMAVNPVFVRDYLGEDVREDYLARMRVWAAKQNVDFAMLQPKVGLHPDDFFDWGHIRSADAVRRLQDALIDRLEFAEL
ncbi:hypothetical protein [uncultured Roseobacter sp.]|uniref:hypothetical protein n=1 Tax=uncultured Roseobacter sp. TaxID=114847 RepID=UPI002601E4E7|nr:hypothetical protein [uncultured Roseobacter sp.]